METEEEMENVKINKEMMKITVKRKTWFLGFLASLTLYFGKKYLGKISNFEEKVIEIPEEKGVLKYKIFLGKGNQVNIENGDYIIIKDTLINKFTNIIFLIWFIILMTDIFVDSVNLVREFSFIFLAAFIIILIISIFKSSYKFIKVTK